MGFLPSVATAQGRTPIPNATPQPDASATTPATNGGNARDTRDQLGQLLNQYPPSLAQVLRLDPSLLANRDYLAPYPQLAAFVAQHPEIARNPVFFLGDARLRVPAERVSAMRVLEEAMGGLALLTAFGTIVGFLVWTI